jgi:hypothetical protein
MVGQMSLPVANEELRQSLHRRHRGRTGLLEVIGVVLVVSVGIGTAWWVNQRTSVGVVDVRSTAATLGLFTSDHPTRHPVGFERYASERSQVLAAFRQRSGQAPF